jgi:hypothetical protein
MHGFAKPRAPRRRALYVRGEEGVKRDSRNILWAVQAPGNPRFRRLGARPVKAEAIASGGARLYAFLPMLTLPYAQSLFGAGQINDIRRFRAARRAVPLAPHDAIEIGRHPIGTPVTVSLHTGT